MNKGNGRLFQLGYFFCFLFGHILKGEFLFNKWHYQFFSIRNLLLVAAAFEQHDKD